MELSESQKKVVHHGTSEKTTMMAGGAIRSGKSYSAGLGMALWMLQDESTADCAIIGQSVEAVMRNIGFDFMSIVADLGARCELDKKFGTRILVGNRNVWIIGASDAKARKRIQGATLKGLMIDEVVLIPKDFFLMAWGRLSVSGSKMWLTFNPESPAHWVKQEVVDRMDAFNAESVFFNLDDNPTLAENVKERYRNSFTGHWARRLIEGEWAGASGLIFPEYESCDKEPIPNGKWRAALDWGASGVLHALLASVKGTQVKVIAESRYDARQRGVRTESDAIDSVVSWLSGASTGASGIPVYVDPSTPAGAKRLIRKNGHKCLDANNEVLTGLSRTAALLSAGTVRICPEKCPELVKEMASYQWDDVSTEKGVDAPIKQNDHGVDALRYLIHSVGFTASGQKTLVSRALRMAA